MMNCDRVVPCKNGTTCQRYKNSYGNSTCSFSHLGNSNVSFDEPFSQIMKSIVQCTKNETDLSIGSEKMQYLYNNLLNCLMLLMFYTQYPDLSIT